MYRTFNKKYCITSHPHSSFHSLSKTNNLNIFCLFAKAFSGCKTTQDILRLELAIYSINEKRMCLILKQTAAKTFFIKYMIINSKTASYISGINKIVSLVFISSNFIYFFFLWLVDFGRPQRFMLMVVMYRIMILII